MRKLIFKNNFNYSFVARMLRWHLNYYLFNKGLPVSAGAFITNACNSRCIMCNIWKNKETFIYPRKAQERAIDALERIGCYYYSVGGGEPTLVKDLPDRLAYAARKIPYVRFVTNGLLMDKELACSLGRAGIKEITISIDGTENVHNLMRGVPDAFQKSWRALDLVCTYAPKVKVVINSVLTMYTLDELRDLGKRLKLFFPQVYWKYSPLSFEEIYRNEGLKASLCLPGEAASISELERFLDDAVSNPMIVNSAVYLRKVKLYFRGVLNLMPEQQKCLYPYFAIEFDWRGFAYPCFMGMCFKNGIPPDDDLEKYFNSPGYHRLQKELKQCNRCFGSARVCHCEPRLNFPLPNLLNGCCKKF